jgi:acyl-CoA reductase-like NAD-dependent aldehyde dehydrogenase
MGMTELAAVSPVDGAEIGVFPACSPDEVAQAVTRGRAAFEAWGSTPIQERLQLLGRLRAVIVDDLDAIVARIVVATGKPDLEALTGDVLTTLDFIAYYEEHAAGMLGSESRPGYRFAPRSEFRVDYEPLGVVGIISPWNYPLQLAMIPLVTALAAGDTVVLKPSELVPSVGALVAEICERAELPPGVVQVVQGGPEVGEALVAARPDKIFFTGSVQTGKKIVARAAEHLVPLELELGGKDPMLVFADAHFERAVNGAVYGAFVNAGQACVSIERVYVAAPIYERFVSAVTEAALRLRVGSDRSSDLGPIIRPAQCDLVEAQVDDALRKGARLTTPRDRIGNRIRPLVLRDVSHDMRVMTEETFGPVLPVMPFDDEAEAIGLANDTSYGLNASVWTQDRARAERVVRALAVGSCAVNDVLKNIANPQVPFGGERESGWGRYHGPEGLRAFSRTKSVMVSDGSADTEMNWFPYRAITYEIVKSLVLAQFGAGSALGRAGAIASQWLGAARSLWRRR